MRKKIIFILVFNVIVIANTIAVVGYMTVRESIERSHQNRLTLARIISDYVEFSLNNNLHRLDDISLSTKTNMKSQDWEAEKRVLETAYTYSIFTEGVFLLDRHGNEVLTYPPHVKYFSNLTYINYVNQVLQYGRPVISNIYTIEPIKKQVIFIMTPLKNPEGRIEGVAGGIFDPTKNLLSNILQSAKIEQNSYIEIIDANEMVIASDNPSRVLQQHNHDSILSKMIMNGESGILECRHGFSHPDSAERPVDRLAFVPLRMAPWGVIVGESEADLFAPAIALQQEYVLFVLIFTVGSFIFSLVMSNKIVRPLRLLTSSADKIAAGDLSTPIKSLGSDEILALSRSFDDMRKKLAESLERSRNQNIELENRVTIRTEQIRQSRRRVEDLLKKIISSQEDERRRIARDLHDTILQDISAFLIQLDICKLHPELVRVEKIDDMREIVTGTIDNIHRVIKDLRPSLLDDLGINAAIRWLLDRHLAVRGINCDLDVVSPIKKRLPPTVEITIFRILQETIVNIARHANAKNVSVTLSAGESSLVISVEDDGDGFDFSELISTPSENGRGLGILGMKERASLIDGRLVIISLPGVGTKVSLEIPLEGQVEHV